MKRRVLFEVFIVIVFGFLLAALPILPSCTCGSIKQETENDDANDDPQIMIQQMMTTTT